jgi:type II secretory pathway component PulJ
MTLTRRRRNNSTGFTLMEVVIATSLTAVLMSVMFMGLRIGANAMRRGEQKLGDRSRSVAAMDMLERQVSSASPRMLSETRDHVAVQFADFRGSSTEMRFVTATSWQADHNRPLYMAKYRAVSRKEGGQQLVISETPLTDPASMSAALFDDGRFRLANDQGSRTQEIGEPADRIDFYYLQPAQQDKPAQWVSEWVPEKQVELPRGIRLQWTRNRHVETATLLVPQYHEPEQR